MNNEQDILRRAQQGDSDAFRQLVEAYQTQVYRLALRMCGESAADDVTQEAFLAAWRALPEFRGTCRFSTWLYRLTTNAAIDHLRREKRRRGMDDVAELELPDDGPGPQEQAEQAETQWAVRRALGQLSEEHRQVLLLRDFREPLPWPLRGHQRFLDAEQGVGQLQCQRPLGSCASQLRSQRRVSPPT